VPGAVGDFLILRSVRDSGGTAIAVEENGLPEWLRLGASLEGIPICPEAAACIGALDRLTASGWIQPHERVVVFNTGAAQKYVEAIRSDLLRIDLAQPLDWPRIEAGG
jgi:threonine synthase